MKVWREKIQRWHSFVVEGEKFAQRFQFRINECRIKWDLTDRFLMT